MRSKAERVVEFDPWKDFGAYSDVDWRAIERSLTGVNLDATLINAYPYFAAEHPEQSKAPLREALQNLANYYAAKAHLKPVPRAERIEQLQQDEAALEAACRTGLHPWIRGALTAKIDEVQRQLDLLVAQRGRDGNENAKRLHRKFWGELLRLWLTLPIERRTHETLRTFLFACSAPIFPVETTRGALAAFTKDNFKPRP
jgi:hypothetical protein